MRITPAKYSSGHLIPRAEINIGNTNNLGTIQYVIGIM